MSLRKHILDLLQRAPLRFREAEEYMDEARKVERREYEVRLVGDVRQAGRHGPRERKVEEPVRGGGERDRLRPHFHGEDLGGVRPRDRTHGDGERAYEKVGADDNSARRPFVSVDDPDGLRNVKLVIVRPSAMYCSKLTRGAPFHRTPSAEMTLKTPDQTEPETHQEKTDEEHRPASPLVDVDDCGDCR